jgi:Flp pilus assembly protein TadD
MKHLLNLLFISTLVIAAFGNVSVHASPKFANRIEGIVYDPNNVPVENARVELQDDTNSTVGSTRTNLQGRFTFVGMLPGRYDIKVMPLGTDLMEQTQEANVTNITRLASDLVYLEFHLQYDKRRAGQQPATAPEAIFVQDVPAEARKLYEDARDHFKEQRDAGMTKLEEAVKIFPDYFDALALLGAAYFEQKNYEKAYPYYVKAASVNQRSFRSFYNLGYSLYQLRRYPEALKPAETAKSLDKSSLDAQLLYGTILRITGDYKKSESELKAADSMAKGKNADVHMQLALLYNRTDRNQDAVSELKTYLKLQPDSPDKKQIEDLIVKLKERSEKPQ